MKRQVYGMERMMGVADNPLRRVLNYASEHFLVGKYPVLYILTVIGTSPWAAAAQAGRGMTRVKRLTERVGMLYIQTLVPFQ